jgi:hypothetical protein
VRYVNTDIHVDKQKVAVDRGNLKHCEMWEFYPEATGSYDTDVGQHRKKSKKP